MFQDILDTAQKNIDTVRRILRTNEYLKKSIYSSIAHDNILIKNLLNDAPERANWLVFDHCASVTRLYAIYEQFVEDLIRGWLEIIPELYTQYSDLPDKIKDTHRAGVGKIIIDFNKDRYQHLSLDLVIRGLLDGISHQDVYKLLPDAFLIHEQNLRGEILQEVFTKAGIDNIWSWLNKSRYIKEFCQENQTTAKGELKQLINYRNDAAHRGTIDNFLGFEELLQSCAFVEVLCKALCELVTYEVIQKMVEFKKATKIGKITDWFPNPQAAILNTDTENISLAVGKTVFLLSESYCQSAIIQSIKINDNPVQEVQTQRAMEIGLKFNVAARKNLNLYLIK